MHERNQSQYWNEPNAQRLSDYLAFVSVNQTNLLRNALYSRAIWLYIAQSSTSFDLIPVPPSIVNLHVAEYVCPNIRNTLKQLHGTT